MPEATVTTDHSTIRKWAEDRGGRPANVAGTGGENTPGMVRLDFDPRDKDLQAVSWDAFFERFDQEKLAFLYQDRTDDGSVSRFHKFIDRAAGQNSH